jgi:hypothetical protein
MAQQEGASWRVTAQTRHRSNPRKPLAPWFGAFARVATWAEQVAIFRRVVAAVGDTLNMIYVVFSLSKIDPAMWRSATKLLSGKHTNYVGLGYAPL